MTSVDSLLSPESTVTSLLASSGHLRSTLYSEPSHTIRYRNRQYESASEALDAYITDFQRSLQTTGTSTGQLRLPKDPVTPYLLHTGYRNKDVLKERLTDRELDFLRLPVGAPWRDPDRLSLTTDDLLVLPSDGSLPVTRTSAFLSQSGGYPLGHSSRSHSRSRSRSSSVPKAPLHHSAPQETLQRRLAAGKALGLDDLLGGRLHPQRGVSLLDLPLSTPGDALDIPVAHHYPRWMTSQKSEMDFSGISSIPDLKYPTWLRECDMPTDPPHRTLPCPPKVPSWLGELEASCEEKRQETQGRQKVICDSDESYRYQAPLMKAQSHRTLRELRLQFAERLLLAEESERSTEDSKPFRDDKIESLIMRAERVLSSPSLGLGGHSGSPGGTEDDLDADRSWDNPPVTFKSPVPVGGTEDQLNVKESQKHMREAQGSCSSGYSSRKHPGPVEALKQMLFSLQAVEQRVTQQKDPELPNMPGVIVSNPLILWQDIEADEVSKPALEDYDTAPGGQSLQRALHHLGRLKHLVDDMNDKEKELEGRDL